MAWGAVWRRFCHGHSDTLLSRNACHRSVARFVMGTDGADTPVRSHCEPRHWHLPKRVQQNACPGPDPGWTPVLRKTCAKQGIWSLSGVSINVGQTPRHPIPMKKRWHREEVPPSIDAQTQGTPREEVGLSLIYPLPMAILRRGCGTHMTLAGPEKGAAASGRRVTPPLFTTAARGWRTGRCIRPGPARKPWPKGKGRHRGRRCSAA